MNPLAAQLRDIHLPQAVSWWPPAAGWWLLGMLLLLILATAAGYVIVRWRRGRAKRRALAELAQAADIPATNALLKRAALAYFDRAQVAPLSGLDWFRFLDNQLPATPALFAADASLWQQLLYGRQATPEQVQQFRGLTRRWLKRALPPTKRRQRKTGHRQPITGRRRSQGV